MKMCFDKKSNSLKVMQPCMVAQDEKRKRVGVKVKSRTKDLRLGMTQKYLN